MKFIVVFFFLVFSISAASGKVYVTNTPSSADVWIILTTNARAADCWILRSDLTSNHVIAEFWVYITDNARAANKWVMITDNRNAADPVSCLLNE